MHEGQTIPPPNKQTIAIHKIVLKEGPFSRMKEETVKNREKKESKNFENTKDGQLREEDENVGMRKN